MILGIFLKHILQPAVLQEKSVLAACWLLVCLFVPFSAQAQNSLGVQLSSPVDCSGLDLCFVQNYVDHNDGPEWQDYHCRHLSYDGHNGTDIRVSYDDMKRGVPVMAVADGVVIGLRDGMDDVSVRSRGKHQLHGKFAGNAVYIDHNGGVETLYSHLMKGSVTVQKGDFVHRGQVIGKVGLSGNTEFPHVELGLRIAGTYVDPFVGESPFNCGQRGRTLWDSPAQKMLMYHPRGVLDAALINGIPDLNKVLLSRKRPFHPNLGCRMSYWAAFYGVRAGDTIHMSMKTPAGKVAAERTFVMESNLAQKMLYISIRSKNGWPSGTYVGRSELIPVEGGESVTVTRKVTVTDS